MHRIQHLQKDGVSYIVNGNGAKDGTLGGQSQGGKAIFAQVSAAAIYSYLIGDG